MNNDMYSASRMEQRRDLRNEIEKARLVRQVCGPQLGLGRRAAGHLGNMLLAAGTHLKQIEQEGRSLADEALTGSAEDQRVSRRGVIFSPLE